MNPIRRLISKSKALISPASESLGYIAFGMAIIMLLTKVLGLVRLQLLTRIYGIRSVELDIFNAANTIPEFIFVIIAIGGINAALIPVLTQTSVNENKEKLKEVFSSIVNLFFLALLILSLLIYIFAPQIVKSVFQLKVGANDTALSPEQIKEFITTLRILIFSPIILCVSSIFSSLLQIKKRFFITQIAPFFYNIGIIATTLILPKFNNDITVLAWGVNAASFLHFLIQLPAIFGSEIKYSPFFISFKNFYVLKAIKQTLPRIIGLSSDYIGNIFQTILALRLPTGSLTSFRLAGQLRDIPISMFGIAIAQSVFPRMSELASTDQKEELQKLFSKAIRTILFWTLPITAVFIVLRTPIVQLTFTIFNKEIGFAETSLISYTLLFVSLGIVFYSLLQLFNRLYFALDDSITPTIVSIGTIFFEIALTFLLVNLFSHIKNLSLNPFVLFGDVDNFVKKGTSDAGIGGMGLAASLSIFLQLCVLGYLLKKKKVDPLFEGKFIFKKIVSFVTMIIVGLIAFKVFDVFFTKDRIVGIFIFTVNVGLAMLGTFYLTEKLQKDEDINILDNPIERLKKAIKGVTRLFKLNKIKGVNT